MTRLKETTNFMIKILKIQASRLHNWIPWAKEKYIINKQLLRLQCFSLHLLDQVINIYVFCSLYKVLGYVSDYVQFKSEFLFWFRISYFHPLYWKLHNRVDITCCPSCLCCRKHCGAKNACCFSAPLNPQLKHKKERM